MKNVTITISALLIAACLILSDAGPAIAETGRVFQANGIKIGEVTQTSAIVWTRLTATPELKRDGIEWKNIKRPNGKSPVPEGKTLADMKAAVPGTKGSIQVVHWPANSAGSKQTSKQESDWVGVDYDTDFTHQFTLSGLSANTAYQVEIRSRAADGTAGPVVHGAFRTAPAADQRRNVTFTVVTGQDYPRRDDAENGHKIYPHMQKLKPDFFVHTGDIEYYDKPKPLATNVALARFKWNRLYALPFERNFHKVTSSYFIKDDHDTLKNDCWPGQKYGDLTWEQGLALFREQVPMGKKTYRTVRWGKDLQVWFVEGRDFRSPNNMPDGPNKTIWGEEQKQWFFKTVKDSDATFKILVSPTPLVGPDRGNKGDNHSNKRFTHEGNQLREFIGKQKNMYVCCGDRHWQYVSVNAESGVREYSCGPTSDKHASGWSNDKRSPMHQYLNVVGGFLAVTIDTESQAKPVAIFRHYSTNGKLLHEDRRPALGEGGAVANEEQLTPERRPRAVVVQPVILCNDDGTSPASYVLPKRLVDRVYTRAGLEFLYLEPIHWNHGRARRGEINLDQIVREGTANSKINRDPRIVTLLFVSAVDGKQGPLGRGMQNGNICFVTLGPQGVDADPDMQAFVVAHEVGHCLNLRHAVDDPAVPNDVPNLQGDGPFDARLAVEGLHDSQRVTVLRSPLVNDRIKFHSLAEGRKLIVDETWEPYISGATDDMLRFSIGLKATDPIPQQPQARIRFAKEKYTEKVHEFPAAEQTLIRKLVNRLQDLTGEQWPCVSRLPWHFIKTDSTFCHGMAHTRGISILLSQRYLDRMVLDESFGLKLLLHEKMHVIQRLQGNRFESLYRGYGFERITLADGELERINASQNPDALHADWAIRLHDDSLWLLVTILAQDDSGKIQFQAQHRSLRQRADGIYEIGDVIEPTDAFEEWKARFPFEVGHDHPNEVSAYLSASLLEEDYLGEQNDRQEAERNRIEQTRKAFCHVLRIRGS